MNWKKNREVLALGPEKANSLITQLEKDVEFLCSERIMDYSLLVGIHDMVKGNKENIRDSTLAEFGVFLLLIDSLGEVLYPQNQSTKGKML